MTLRFPDTVGFSGHDAPSRIEADIFDLEVHGQLPPDLAGTWYRCGPDPQYPPLMGDDVYINGDGMMSMFRFADGHVDYKSRYVVTERFLAERKARRSLFGLYRNSFTDHPSVAGVNRTTANTTAIWHAGRLLALKEDSRPYEIDPDTLATRGVYDWGGHLRTKTVSAHPKIDPHTGELLFYGYESSGDGSRDMAFCVADRSGKLVKEEWFEAPYAAMVHDFAVTEKYAIFPIFPAITDLERMRAGGPHWMTDLSRKSYIGVLPRDGTAQDLRWFSRPGGQSFHTINAYSEGTTVHLDLLLSEINPFPYVPDVSGAPYDPQKAAPIPTRFSMDLAGGDATIQERPLGPISGDVPRMDERFVGRDYRYAYMGMVDPTRAMVKSGPIGVGFNMAGRLDVTTGETHTWFGDDTDGFQEPIFVPSGAQEGQGYLLAIVERHAEHRADVGVFDAAAVHNGPLAIVRLPMRLRMAFHGCWVPASERSAR
ncbi:MAG TPA: carotenoid oxygenase family protein [Acetobacteraceae bacterium]|nr:carotenoid oxygenase family protein [Acetobacteraceae bacterium]